MIHAGIIGATGYAGEELLRLLLNHKDVKIKKLASQSYAGSEMADLYGSYLGFSPLPLEELDPENFCQGLDVVFTGLPHSVSLEVVPQLLQAGVRVIDLSGDFRYDDAETYETWYGIHHDQPDLLAEAVYGLPEFYRSRIAAARLIGNPGCYTTASILGLYPALKAGLLETDSIVIDAKSGVSGAGRSAKLNYSFCECQESLKAYGVATHRHTSEIEQELSKAAGVPILLEFTPHLLPVKRGILATLHAKLKPGVTQEDIDAAYQAAYQDAPFTFYLGNSLPELKYVVGSNNCFIGCKVDSRLGRLVGVSCIDNLIKGAAGQAIQNMNLLFGLEETAGLPQVAMYL